MCTQLLKCLDAFCYFCPHFRIWMNWYLNGLITPTSAVLSHACVLNSCLYQSELISKAYGLTTGLLRFFLDVFGADYLAEVCQQPYISCSALFWNDFILNGLLSGLYLIFNSSKIAAAATIKPSIHTSLWTALVYPSLRTFAKCPKRTTVCTVSTCVQRTWRNISFSWARL